MDFLTDLRGDVDCAYGSRGRYWPDEDASSSRAIQREKYGRQGVLLLAEQGFAIAGKPTVRRRRDFRDLQSPLKRVTFWPLHECYMRRERLYLQDILEACDMIRAFLASTDASAFLASELHKAATLQKLTVIGEAADHPSQAFREAHPQVEWRDIVAFRNIVDHAYFAVQRDIV